MWYKYRYSWLKTFFEDTELKQSTFQDIVLSFQYCDKSILNWTTNIWLHAGFNFHSFLRWTHMHLNSFLASKGKSDVHFDLLYVFEDILRPYRNTTLTDHRLKTLLSRPLLKEELVLCTGY